MYSTKTISEKLISEGFTDMTVRKINYYIFEKKIFKISGTGKNVFSEDDFEKLKVISLLKSRTKCSLSEIKELIENHTVPEILEMLKEDYTKFSATLNDVNLFADTNTLSTSKSLSPSNTVAFPNNPSCTTINNTSVNNLVTNNTSANNSYTYSTDKSVGMGYSNKIDSARLSFSSPNYGYGTTTQIFPSNLTFVSNIEEKKENLRMKIADGIFIDYTEKADKELLEKIIEVSKILTN